MKVSTRQNFPLIKLLRDKGPNYVSVMQNNSNKKTPKHKSQEEEKNVSLFLRGILIYSSQANDIYSDYVLT